MDEKNWHVVHQVNKYDDYSISVFDSKEEAKTYYELSKDTVYYVALIDVIEEHYMED